MIVVSNTLPIINLACIGQLDLLRQIYGQITIPDAVFTEITMNGIGQPGAEPAEANPTSPLSEAPSCKSNAYLNRSKIGGC
jgi:hypothetical protein